MSAIALFQPRVKTVGKISDFLADSRTLKAEKVTALALGGAALTYVLTPQMASALDLTSKIVGAFDPIIKLMQGLSYPVAFIMLTSGFLVLMTGNKQKGLNIIKWAAIGYVGMQFAPAIMQILVNVGKAMVVG